GGDLKAGDNIYINYDGADGDSYLYFYEAASATGASLMFNDGAGIFTFNHGLSTSAGNVTFAGDLRVSDRIFVNYNGVEGDGWIYFYDGGAEAGEHLKWDDTDDQFEFSNDLKVFGQIDCQLPTGGTSGQGIAMTSFDGVGSLSLENGTGTANVMAPSIMGKASHTTSAGLLIQGETFADDGSTAASIHMRAKDPDGNSAIDAGVVLAVQNWTTSLLSIDYAGVVKIDANVLDMDSHKIINVTDPTANQEAATKKYVDDNIGGASQSRTLAFYPSWRNANNWFFENTDEYLRVTTIGTPTQMGYVYIDMPEDADSFTVTGTMTLTATGAVTMTVEGEIEKRLTTGSWTAVAGSVSTVITHGGGGGDTTSAINWSQAFTVGWEVGAQYRLKITRDLTTTVNVSVVNVALYGATIQS
ncbi:hypothetical protein LCGC14_2516350, partial [marine sediment metagenome]